MTEIKLMPIFIKKSSLEQSETVFEKEKNNCEPNFFCQNYVIYLKYMSF